MLWMHLAGFVLLILAASEIFVNALEHLGERLGISEGVTGSLFAAVGTALPETLVPLIALLAGTADPHANEAIGTGAILGAPLMLSTLSVSLLALVTLRRRGFQGEFAPERSGIVRDFNMFLASFSLACAVMFIPHGNAALRLGFAFVLLLGYFLYVLVTLRASAHLVQSGHGTEAHAPLMLSRIGLPDHMAVLLFQLAAGIFMLVQGADGFIVAIHDAAPLLGISPLLLALLIVPVATELPEKVNSIRWVRHRRDTLAFGNITGAMVFQGSILPAIGIALTDWQPHSEIMPGIVCTLAGALWLRLCLMRGHLRVWQLGVNAALYAGYLAISLH